VKKIKSILLTLVLLVGFTLKGKSDCSIFRKIRLTFEHKYSKARTLSEVERYNCFAYQKGILKPIDLKNDTLFLINEIFPDGDIYSIIWNKYDTVNYLHESGNGYNPVIVNRMLFSIKVLNVIGDWSVDSLNYFSSKTGAFDGGFMYATRIILDAKNASIDCFEIPYLYEWIE
jgi:hypothetical protein